MDAIENLLNRRSIRKYKDKQISEKELDIILAAGTYAPTAKGTQSPLIVSVQNKEDINLMSKINANIWGQNIDPFYGAPTVVVVFAEKNNPNGVQDASLVLGNLMNAAHAVGVGSCWINRAKETFETVEGIALLKKWGIDGEWEGVGSCILGYQDCDDPTPKQRKDNYIVKIN